MKPQVNRREVSCGLGSTSLVGTFVVENMLGRCRFSRRQVGGVKLEKLRGRRRGCFMCAILDKVVRSQPSYSFSF